MSRQLRVLVGCEMSGRVRDEFAKRGWEAWSADLEPSETPPYLAVCRDDMMLPPYSSVTDPSAVKAGNHYQGDVRDLFSWDHPVNENRFIDGQCNYIASDAPLWDLFIGFPPCDHLSLAGARWWAQKRADGRQDDAAEFFMEMVNAPASFVAIENPRGDMTRRFRPPDQVIQPWWFGDPFRKNTCLWLRNADKPSYRVNGTDEALPLLRPTRSEEGYGAVGGLGRVTTGGGSWRTDKAAGRKAMSAHEDSEGRKNRARVRNRTFPGFAASMACQWGSFVEAALA